MSSVPAEWTSLITEHRAAQVSRDVMRDAGQPQQARDLATAAYARQCDRIIDLLDVMSGRLVLGRITMLLARKDRT